MSDGKITIFIADDSDAVVEAITVLASADDSLQVVGHCGDGLKVLDEVQASKPDVLVLDISLPGHNGLEVCGMVKAQAPATSVLMLSMNTSEGIVLDALARGASAYIPKESVAMEFFDAVHAISQGKTYVGHDLPASVHALAKEKNAA